MYLKEGIVGRFRFNLRTGSQPGDIPPTLIKGPLGVNLGGFLFQAPQASTSNASVRSGLLHYISYSHHTITSLMSARTPRLDVLRRHLPKNILAAHRYRLLERSLLAASPSSIYLQ